MQYQPLSTIMSCDDSKSVVALDLALDELGISTHISPSGSGAIHAMQKAKFDLLLVDLDGPGALEILKFQTSMTEHQPRLVIAFSQDPVALSSARKHRVHFVLRKPFTSHLMSRTLKAAYHILLKGRRIPFRKPVCIAANATISGDPKRPTFKAATVLDISYSGLCMQLKGRVRTDAMVILDFRLPETGAPLRVSGQVRWSDTFGKAGIEFSSVPPREQEALRRWLHARSPWDSALPQNTAATRPNPAN